MTENAVSPVIGVILMVAITVILAGIVAMFATGMISTIPPTKLIGITAQQTSGNTITVTYVGGQDSRDFLSAAVNVTDDNGNYLEVKNLTNQVGNTVIAKGDLKMKNYVVVVGTFTDGKEQVIYNSYL